MYWRFFFSDVDRLYLYWHDGQNTSTVNTAPVTFLSMMVSIKKFKFITGVIQEYLTILSCVGGGWDLNKIWIQKAVKHGKTGRKTQRGNYFSYEPHYCFLMGRYLHARIENVQLPLSLEHFGFLQTESNQYRKFQPTMNFSSVHSLLLSNLRK